MSNNQNTNLHVLEFQMGDLGTPVKIRSCNNEGQATTTWLANGDDRISIDTNGSYPYRGGFIDVEVEGGITGQPFTITQNGVYDVPVGIKYDPITVEVDAPQTTLTSSVDASYLTLEGEEDSNLFYSPIPWNPSLSVGNNDNISIPMVNGYSLEVMAVKNWKSPIRKRFFNVTTKTYSAFTVLNEAARFIAACSISDVDTLTLEQFQGLFGETEVACLRFSDLTSEQMTWLFGSVSSNQQNCSCLMYDGDIVEGVIPTCWNRVLVLNGTPDANNLNALACSGPVKEVHITSNFTAWSVNVYSGNWFSNYTGPIYVPANEIESYKIWFGSSESFYDRIIPENTVWGI